MLVLHGGLRPPGVSGSEGKVRANCDRRNVGPGLSQLRHQALDSQRRRRVYALTRLEDELSARGGMRPATTWLCHENFHQMNTAATAGSANIARKIGNSSAME